MYKSTILILIGSLFFWTGLWVTLVWAETEFDAMDRNAQIQFNEQYRSSVPGSIIYNASDSTQYWPRNTTAVESTAKETQSTKSDNSLGWGASSGGPNDLLSPNFRLDPNSLSPSQKRYTAGTKTNLTNLLKTIGNTLLMATSTLAVLSIVVGGLMIATTGPSDRAAKGKTIITLNIIAIFIALFSYSLIRLVSWIIAA